ncbi:MAG TPA: GMC family oxidoreductase N-terminal domain-containing protein [Solirubrobacteraceae bacterium]
MSAAALRAVCDAFLPALGNGDGRRTPSASELGVPEELARSIAANPSAAERRRAAAGLRLIAVGAGGARRIDRATLLAWADSRSPQRRAAFLALRRGVLATAYAMGGSNGDRNPLWEEIGYPGPPGRLPDAPPRALRPEPAPAGDTTLDCDVVVVGSGAGGGPAAAVLAQAGLDVVVVEAGGHHDSPDFDGAELPAFRSYYLGAGALATEDQSVVLAAGTMLGGGTVINYTTSFRTGDEVRAEWAAVHGLPAFAGERYDAALDAVCERLGVTQEHSRPGARDERVQAGLHALGLHAGRMPRNVGPACDQGERCGRCGYGCPFGAKRSSLHTWLEDAAAGGARLLVDTEVRRVTVKDGAAAGVEAIHRPTGARVTVRSRAVVAAAGALHTPALLLRSGARNPHVGRHLRLHAGFGVAGIYPEALRPWEGTMQSVYSDAFRDLDGNGYGVKLVTLPVGPAILAQFAPWRSAESHFGLMQALPHTVIVGLQLRDRSEGRVRLGRDGRPIASYAHVPGDLAHLRTALHGAARVHLAAGAQHVYTGHTQLVETHDSPEELVARASAAGWRAGQCAYSSFHQLGSVRMGSHPTTSACGPEGESWDVRDLWICDASALPTATGFNPMVTITATAWMNARALAERLA